MSSFVRIYKKLATHLTVAAMLACGLAPTASGQTSEIQEVSLVHVGDVIDVDVEGSFEFDWRGPIGPDGFLDGINTYGDPIYGQCRTENAIATDIAKAFSKVLRQPKITVRLIDRSRRPAATISGAVRTPYRFGIRRAVSLRELIVASGGLNDDAGGVIKVYRPAGLSCKIQPDGTATPTGNGGLMLDIKIEDLVKGSADADIPILSGDIITVERASPIYVTGAVGNPRPIAAKGPMVLSRVIAMAGGLAKDAIAGDITIFRRDGKETVVIKADLEKIENGSAADIALLPFDVVEIAGKGRAKQKYPPSIAASEAIQLSQLPLKVIE